MPAFDDPAARGGTPFRRPIRDRLLPLLPGRIARPAHALSRRADLRALARRREPVVVLATNDLSRSGAPFLVAEMARLLREDGFAPVVVSPLDGPLASDLRAAGVPTLVDHRLNKAPAWLAGLAARARAAICNTVDTAGAAAALARAVPTLWYLHEVGLLKERLADDAVRRTLSGVAWAWAGSPLCAEQVAGVRPDVAVVPYGVVPLGRPPTGPATPPLRVGVFGSLEPRKGQDLAVGAYAALTPEERGSIELTLYGRVLVRPFADRVLDEAARAGVAYAGELDRSGYADALRASDAVLVPSREDTLPLVSLDALAAGRTLLLAPTVGTVAWLTPGVDALVAEDTSVEALAALLRTALARAPEAASIGAAARSTFAGHFSPEAFHARLRGVLASATGARA